MYFLPILFLLLASCSDNLPYNDTPPHISIDILTPSDTILVKDTVYFQAKINPSPAYVRPYWVIKSRLNQTLQRKESFDSCGVYDIRFYAVDALNDTLSYWLSITVSSKPVCEDLSLDFFQGSPVFQWICHNENPNETLSYNLKLNKPENEGKPLLDTTLQQNYLMLGEALPDILEITLTATNNYGFKTQIDSTWSRP